MKPIFVLAFLLLTITLAAQNQCYRDLRKVDLRNRVIHVYDMMAWSGAFGRFIY